MTDQRLKTHIFIFMILAKIVAIFLVLFHWRTGGYSQAEAMATIAIVIPLFTVYLTVMVKDALKNPYVDQRKKGKTIKTSIVFLTYLIFPLYIMAILYFINLKPQPGPFSFENLQTAIAGVESGFGIYIGQIVLTLYKSNGTPG